MFTAQVEHHTIKWEVPCSKIRKGNCRGIPSTRINEAAFVEPCYKSSPEVYTPVLS